MLFDFASELEKIAKSDGRADPATATAGAAAAGAVASRSKPFTVEGPGSRHLIIYYTDPRRGAGHLAQGRAVVRALEGKGYASFENDSAKAAKALAQGKKVVELVDFDNRFGSPERLTAYNHAFNSYRADPRKSFKNSFRYKREFTRFYFGDGVDRKAVKAVMTSGARIVFANPQLQWVTGKMGVPSIIMHTDQHPWRKMDVGPSRFGRVNQHIVTESAVDALSKQHKTIRARAHVVPDLAIQPTPSLSKKMVDKLTGRQIKLDGKFNIVVSGGAQGWDTHTMAQQLAKADLPEGTVVHVVTGGNKQPDGTIKPTADYPDVKKLETATAGKRVQVRAYGWSPLNQMMHLADMNVLRPHGTTITEATAASKPFVMFMPDAPLEMEKLDAIAASKHTGQPWAGSGKLGSTVKDVIDNYQEYHAKAKAKAPGARRAAEAWADAILKTKNYLAHPRTGRAWTAARRGLKVTAVGAGAVAIKSYMKTTPPKSPLGHWRKLPLGHKGKNEHGAPMHGKTWVRKKQKPHSGVVRR